MYCKITLPFGNKHPLHYCEITTEIIYCEKHRFSRNRQTENPNFSFIVAIAEGKGKFIGISMMGNTAE